MNRERLPQRRRVERFNLEVGGISYTAEVGFYPDGRLGEIFLNAGKSGTHLSVATAEIAIAVSFALQHGCNVGRQRHVGKNSRGHGISLVLIKSGIHQGWPGPDTIFASRSRSSARHMLGRKKDK